MKVLMVNGSPHPQGNTSLALAETRKVFETEGVEVEYVQLGQQPVRGCTACGVCAKTGKCIFDDAVNETAPLFEAADGLVVGQTDKIAELCLSRQEDGALGCEVACLHGHHPASTHGSVLE